MTKAMKDIRAFMGKEEIQGRDACDLSFGSKSFPDSATYRIEVSGVEQILHSDRSSNEKM